MATTEISELEAEMLDVTGEQGMRRGEHRQDYLGRLLDSFDKLPNADAVFDKLSKDAQGWYNDATEADMIREAIENDANANDDEIATILQSATGAPSPIPIESIAYVRHAMASDGDVIPDFVEEEEGDATDDAEATSPSAEGYEEEREPEELVATDEAEYNGSQGVSGDYEAEEADTSAADSDREPEEPVKPAKRGEPPRRQLPQRRVPQRATAPQRAAPKPTPTVRQPVTKRPADKIAPSPARRAATVANKSEAIALIVIRNPRISRADLEQKVKDKGYDASSALCSQIRQVGKLIIEVMNKNGITSVPKV